MTEVMNEEERSGVLLGYSLMRPYDYPIRLHRGIYYRSYHV